MSFTFTRSHSSCCLRTVPILSISVWLGWWTIVNITSVHIRALSRVERRVGENCGICCNHKVRPFLYSTETLAQTSSVIHITCTTNTTVMWLSECYLAKCIPYGQKYWWYKYYLVISPPNRKCGQNLDLAVKVAKYDVIMKTCTGLIQHNIYLWRNKNPFCHHRTNE